MLLKAFAIVLIISHVGCTQSRNAPNNAALQPKPRHTALSHSETQVEETKYSRHIQFVNGPTNTEAEFPLRFSIQIVDQDGKIVDNYNEQVRINIQGFPPGGSTMFLTGNNTAKLERGQAEIKDLSIEIPGREYILNAVATNIYGVSKPFEVTPPQPRDVTLVFNGQRKTVRFEPPNVLIDRDGERFPVYTRNLSTMNYRGKNFRVEIKSPTEVHVTEIR
jgi:hypothetical protein